VLFYAQPLRFYFRVKRGLADAVLLAELIDGIGPVIFVMRLNNSFRFGVHRLISVRVRFREDVHEDKEGSRDEEIWRILENFGLIYQGPGFELLACALTHRL
jgi:hypothetical protein